MLHVALTFALALTFASCDVTADDGELVQMRRLMEKLEHQMEEQRRDMEEKMEEQNRVMEQQRFVMQKQITTLQARVADQNTVIHQLHTTVSAQQTVLTEQGRLLAVLQSSQQSHPQAVTEGDPSSPHTQVLKQPTPVKPDMTVTMNVHSLKPRSDLAHQAMTSRSDDNGPLEVVVTQMSHQLTTMDADVQALKNSDHQQDLNIQDARSSTFTRWGNSHCPAGADLVYSGVVGGSWLDRSGGGDTYLCLTMNPVLHDHIGGSAGTNALLYGTEYKTGDSHQNEDAVCAVCRSSQATTIMIPGTNVCTQGWTRQYSGFLMAERESHPTASNFICVDSAMEGRVGGDADHDGKTLYYTVTQCGSLPCHPYVHNKVVTCVVCSK